MNPSETLAAVGAVVAHLDIPFAPLDPRPAPPNSGHYKGEGKARTYTKEDKRAFNKRVSKRRKKKGYR